MKFFAFLLLTATLFTSCATRKYGCKYSNNTKPTGILRSTGYVKIVDSSMVLIKPIDGVVVSDEYDLLKCNFLVVKGEFKNNLKSFNNKVIKFEFTKNAQSNDDIMYVVNGCVEEVQIKQNNVEYIKLGATN